MCPLEALIHCAARSPENVLFNTLRYQKRCLNSTALIKTFAFLARTLPCYLTTIVYCLAHSPEGILLKMLRFKNLFLVLWLYYHKYLLRLSGAWHGFRTALVHSVFGSIEGVFNKLCYSGALSGSLTVLSWTYTSLFGRSACSLSAFVHCVIR